MYYTLLQKLTRSAIIPYTNRLFKNFFITLRL